MKRDRILSVAVATHLLICTGCGGKKETAAPTPDPSAAKQKSVDELVGSSQNAPPPPPAPEAPAPAQAAQSQPGQPASAATEPQAGANSEANGSPQSWSSAQKFQRNQSWMGRIASGDAELKKQALAEIQKANLSAAEMAEFRKMCQFYGVKY